MNSGKLRHRILDRLFTVLIQAGALFSALLLASALPDALLHNSDILYAPSFFDDLWRGVDISGWALTPAPYFFPDLVVYGVFDAVLRFLDAGTATRIDMALRLTAAVFYMLNGAGFVLLLKEMRPVSYRSGFLIWTTITLLFLQLPFFSAPFLAAHIPTHHSGLLPIVLLFWTLWLRKAEPVDTSVMALLRANARRYMTGLFVLPTLISDAQLLPLIFIPAFLLAGYGIFFREDHLRHGVDAFLLSLTWLLAERLIPRIRYGLVFFPSVEARPVFEALLTVSPDRILKIASDQEFATTLLLFLISALLFRVHHRFFKRRDQAATAANFETGDRVRQSFKAEAALLLGAGAGLLAALVFHVGLSAHLDDVPPMTGRYLHFLYVIVFPFVPALIVLSVSSRLRRSLARRIHREQDGRPAARLLQRFLSPRLILVCISQLPFAMPALRPGLFPVSGLLLRGERSAAALEARCLRAVAIVHGVTGPLYGISDYWHAKRLSVFSDQVRLLPVELKEPTKLYFWITNLSWFDDEQIVYRFAVMDGLDHERIAGLYGEPASRDRCGGLEIWWYGDDSPIRHEPSRLQEFARVIGIPYRARGKGAR